MKYHLFFLEFYCLPIGLLSTVQEVLNQNPISSSSWWMTWDGPTWDVMEVLFMKPPTLTSWQENPCGLQMPMPHARSAPPPGPAS